jgi:hypothetical protein
VIGSGNTATTPVSSAAATCRERAHDCGSDWCPFDRIACGKPLPCPRHPTLCEDCRRPHPSGLCASCTEDRERRDALWAEAEAEREATEQLAIAMTQAVMDRTGVSETIAAQAVAYGLKAHFPEPGAPDDPASLKVWSDAMEATMDRRARELAAQVSS